MQLALHPQVRFTPSTLGVEGAPLLVIDNVLADPDRLVRKAVGKAFVPQSTMFPGIRAEAPFAYRQFLETALRPHLAQYFELAPGPFAFPMCHYSLVTTPVGQLAFLQRVPHIDSVRGDGLASVHYLFRGNWGGTSFYRHRATGFEVIDAARRETYFGQLDQESRSAQAPAAAYIDDDTALFERIGRVDAVYNRMVVYRRNSLHSGRIDNAHVPPPDPLTGRLSVNCFIDIGT
ncbi:MAG TPA: DUF6445 family protein [Stenotrophomonas sp.]|jgi:hypothetical protein